MTNRILSIGAVLASIGMAASARSAHADEKTLRKVIFGSHTNGDDKDHDTSISIKVLSADGAMTIAHADGIESSGDDSKQYKDHSDHNGIGIQVDAEDVAKSACAHFRAQICISPNGHDGWEFDATVQLVFSDKSNLTASGGGLKLDHDHRCTTISAP